LVSLIGSVLLLFGIGLVEADVDINDLKITVEQYIEKQQGTITENFIVNTPMVVTVKDDLLTTKQKPLITGLAPNHTTLRIYLDDMFVDTLIVAAENETMVIFNYQPQWLLARKVHSVYVVAVNSRGIVSKSSNRMYFKINSTLIPQISATRIEASSETPITSSSMALPIINLNSYQALIPDDLLVSKIGLTKEFLLFLITVEILVAKVWLHAEN